MMKRFSTILLALVLGSTAAMAQHTIGLSGGAGYSNARFYPAEFTKVVFGTATAGFSWRYYGSQPGIGCVGVDVEYMQRGYSYAPYSSTYEEGEEMLYYTREINSIMVPIVWQPHFYLFNHHMRVFIDAAATFNYNFSSSYTNEWAESMGKDDWQGDYEYKLTRDNRWGYGLMGGGGVALLFGRYEFFARARYYFGYSDILRNRNKYSDNYVDGSENPFGYTPVRSPMDNLTISLGINYRLSELGFSTWNKKKKERDNSLNEGFNYNENLLNDE